MIPVGINKTRVENEIYRHRGANDEEFAAVNAFYRQVLQEDKVLCDGAQVNLDAGVFTNGELHPVKEKVGPCPDIPPPLLCMAFTSSPQRKKFDKVG